MRITVNGTATDVEPDLTVAGLVETLTPQRARVAVALGGEVVPRSAWASTRLAPGDTVEVLAAVAGG